MLPIVRECVCGLFPVGSPVGPARVGAQAHGQITDEGGLVCRSFVAAGLSHPCEFGRPPGPCDSLAFQSCGSRCKDACGAALFSGLLPVVVLRPSHAAVDVFQDSRITEPVECVGQGCRVCAGVACQLVAGLGLVGGCCPDVSCFQAQSCRGEQIMRGITQSGGEGGDPCLAQACPEGGVRWGLRRARWDRL